MVSFMLNVPHNNAHTPEELMSAAAGLDAKIFELYGAASIIYEGRVYTYSHYTIQPGPVFDKVTVFMELKEA